MKTDLKVINLFGGPGTGKSTTAAYIFHELKCAGLDVELITEYAKDIVWEKRQTLFTDQVYICAKQNRRMERLVGSGIDVVVTDSPLILGALYTPDDYYQNFKPLLIEMFKSYKSSLNIYLHRGFDYNPIGRNQTADEAKAIDTNIIDLLKETNVPIHYSTNQQNAQWKHNLMAEIQGWIKTK